jgi:hypothetical protein
LIRGREKIPAPIEKPIDRKTYAVMAARCPRGPRSTGENPVVDEASSSKEVTFIIIVVSLYGGAGGDDDDPMGGKPRDVEVVD